MVRQYLFTSESVSAGHPDKLADTISDAVLDHFLARDCEARVACETLVADHLVVVAGEVTTTQPGAFSAVERKVGALVREVLRDAGYGREFPGIDPGACEVRVHLNQQSPDIRDAVVHRDGTTGAGDQGTVFGYATKETAELMPLALSLAHALVRRHAALRRAGDLPWLGPDAKSQVTVRYEGDNPVGVETVVFSTQHAQDAALAAVREAVVAQIIEPVIHERWRRADIRYRVNPGGPFVIGGPTADTGLTGRKIVVDTYGGACSHGGGAFSGKDATKVDRSGAYMARYVAKNVVAAGLAGRCTVQIAYAIGVPEPVSLRADLHGTGNVDETEIEDAILDVFDLTPAGIIEALDLRRPIFRRTAVYGHFGREDEGFPWERMDRAHQLAKRMGKTVWYNREDQKRLSRFTSELNSEGGLSDEALAWWLARY